MIRPLLFDGPVSAAYHPLPPPPAQHNLLLPPPTKMLVGAISSAFLLYVPSIIGLPGVWLGLTLFMALRMAAGYYRILSKCGPWWFLHMDLQKA